ncbi:4'-phosphopantetheinyl transferase family protein [Methylobacterium crusticola]|uniref:4'-phosphopantetheinyl transferase family protein n=1 Tax=Methylobacterium crusticola TaxID=1697972 RepID=UPI001EE1E192|nr:4'-phosphopantetheinyl transferase superfamily protein [Methylobacterium crusticola]
MPLDRLVPVLGPGEALAVVAPAGIVATALAPARRALPPDETARIARFRQPQDRLEREAAHGLLRHLLGGLLGRPPAGLVLVRDAFGRPALPDARDLDLNLSHGAGWVAAALARGGRIGVDVEGAARPVDWDALGPHFLHPAELAEFRALPAGARPRRALEIWAVKEACLKASGEGLSAVPETVRLVPDGAAWRLDHRGLRLRAASLVLGDGARFAWSGEAHLDVRVVGAPGVADAAGD